MPKVSGWLFIGRKSVKFVADDGYYSINEIPWNDLNDQNKLRSFLRKFVPAKEQKKSSYSSYYIEVSEDDLMDWFAEED